MKERKIGKKDTLKKKWEKNMIKDNNIKEKQKGTRF